jgi:hypothetical protein
MATAVAELLLYSLMLLELVDCRSLGCDDAVKMVAKDCGAALSTRRFSGGLTNSLLLRKKSTAVIANWKSASRKRRPWKECNCDLEYSSEAY